MNVAMRLTLAVGSVLWMPFAWGQATLGAVLDAGAKRMSPADFEAQIVQRVLVGPSPSGGELEIMYASNGTVQGTGRHPTFSGIPVAGIGGEWKIENERACSSMRIGGIPLPYRCQIWFKLGDKYFVSDSDTDRSAKVLSRTIKQ